LFEEETRRSHTTEAERSRLSEELAVQRSRLQRIAEASPVGMFSISRAGLILEANDRWFQLTGHPRDELYEMSWVELYKESSLSKLQEGWARLTKDGRSWSAELELKKDWFDPVTGEKVDNWVLADCQPEFAEDGTVRSIMGSLTDITLQKRSAKDAEARARLSEQLLQQIQETEALQKQRLKEAEETRRQQNNFIDITSQ
jgi:PAS domain S-box-containing protein